MIQFFYMIIFIYFRSKASSGEYDGFYISRKYGSNKVNRSICFASMDENVSMEDFYSLSEDEKNLVSFKLFYPHTGEQHRLTNFADLQATALQISLEDAQRYWTKLYSFAEKECQHVFWYGKCEDKSDCDVNIYIL